MHTSTTSPSDTLVSLNATAALTRVVSADGHLTDFRRSLEGIGKLLTPTELEHLDCLADDLGVAIDRLRRA
jgi:hypothetical protein